MSEENKDMDQTEIKEQVEQTKVEETKEEVVAEKEAASEEVKEEVSAEEKAEAPVVEEQPAASTESVEGEGSVEDAPEGVKVFSEEVPEDTAEDTEEEEEESPLDLSEEEEEFSWEKLENGLGDYDSKERTQLEEMYTATLSSVIENEVVDGSVVNMTDREVIIDIGAKSEGVISLNEFRYNPELKVGDTVEVLVDRQEDKNGQLVLSHRKARTIKAWDRVNAAHDNDEIVQGFVKCRTKGGMIVDVFGIEAFLPGSQIDVKPIRDYDVYVEKSMEFKVVKINKEFKNVVVSHKALIEADIEQQKKEIISKLEKGQVLEGTVKNITSYGVFIDLGGVDGLIHITDLSWSRVNHPSEILDLDQTLNVVILDFDEDKSRIQLGLKQLSEHPWDKLDTNMNIGDKVKGKVVVLADYGAFVEIMPGVEGLIHVSEMSWSSHLRSAGDFVKVGDEIDAVVLTLDREERKMSLGVKQLTPDPWNDITTKYPIGSKHPGVVRNFTNFGVFLELEEGIDGLVHISDLSWTKKIKHPADFTKIGATLDVIVLDIDTENRRLSLGHKQIEENPWDTYESIYFEGSVHDAKVVKEVEKGCEVLFEQHGLEAFCPQRHMVKEDGGKIKFGEEVRVKVIEFNRDGRRLVVSHTEIHKDLKNESREQEKATATKEAKATNRAIKQVQSKIEKSTLGDLDVLSDLKEKMKKEEEKGK
jgi:small subunit ribosomal protein S1